LRVVYHGTAFQLHSIERGPTVFVFSRRSLLGGCQGDEHGWSAGVNDEVERTFAVQLGSDNEMQCFGHAIRYSVHLQDWLDGLLRRFLGLKRPDAWWIDGTCRILWRTSGQGHEHATQGKQ